MAILEKILEQVKNEVEARLKEKIHTQAAYMNMLFEVAEDKGMVKGEYKGQNMINVAIIMAKVEKVLPIKNLFGLKNDYVSIEYIGYTKEVANDVNDFLMLRDGLVEHIKKEYPKGIPKNEVHKAIEDYTGRFTRNLSELRKSEIIGRYANKIEQEMIIKD